MARKRPVEGCNDGEEKSMVRTGRASILLSVLVFGAIAASCASQAPDPDRIAWDQAKVTDLAQQLSAAMTNVRQASMKDPTIRNPSTTNRLAARQFLDTLRDLEASCRQLARRLEGGGGFEETLPVARRIGTLLRDAQDTSRRLMETEAQRAVIDPAVAIINRISPFYSSTSPLMENPLNP